MKKTILITLIISVLIIEKHCIACSTFCLSDSNEIVIGYSFDWYSGHGFVVTNNKGMKKTAFMPFEDTPVEWISKYGSITFNLAGKEFPFAGMNEQGLVVTQMWLNDTKYQEADERGAITELQWIQYQLDNFQSVNEVIQSNNILRITNKTAIQLHFFICDREGNVAIIEFLDGRLVYHTGDELPVPLICNDKYDKSMKSLIGSMNFKEKDTDLSLDMEDVKNKPGDNRFTKGFNAIERYKQQSGSNIIDSAFGILDVLRQRHTKWNIVFSIKDFQMYYRTNENVKIRKINMNDFEFGCNAEQLMLDVNVETTNKRSDFEGFTLGKNRQYLDYVIKNIIPKVDGLNNVPVELWNNMADYPGKVECTKN